MKRNNRQISRLNQNDYHRDAMANKMIFPGVSLFKIILQKSTVQSKG